MSVPEAAVLAAAEAMHGLTGAGPWATLDERAREYRVLEARGALESAAPHILKDISKARKGDLFRFTWAQRAWLRHNPYRSEV